MSLKAIGSLAVAVIVAAALFQPRPLRGQERANAEVVTADEAATLAACFEAEKIARAMPSEATEFALLQAVGEYSRVYEQAHPIQPRPYLERVPIQLRTATRDLSATGDVFRFVRGVRHAVFPILDHS